MNNHLDESLKNVDDLNDGQSLSQDSILLSMNTGVAIPVFAKTFCNFFRYGNFAKLNPRNLLKRNPNPATNSNASTIAKQHTHQQHTHRHMLTTDASTTYASPIATTCASTIAKLNTANSTNLKPVLDTTQYKDITMLKPETRCQNVAEVTEAVNQYVAKRPKSSKLSNDAITLKGENGAEFHVTCKEKEGPFGGSKVIFSLKGNNERPITKKSVAVFGSKKAGKKCVSQMITLTALRQSVEYTSTTMVDEVIGKIGHAFLPPNCTSVEIHNGKNELLTITIVPCPWDLAFPKPSVFVEYLKANGIRPKQFDVCALVIQNHFVRLAPAEDALLRWLTSVMGGAEKITPLISYADANVPPVIDALKHYGVHPGKAPNQYNNIVFNASATKTKLNAMYLDDGVENATQFLDLEVFEVGGAALEGSDSEGSDSEHLYVNDLPLTRMIKTKFNL